LGGIIIENHSVQGMRYVFDPLQFFIQGTVRSISDAYKFFRFKGNTQ